MFEFRIIALRGAILALLALAACVEPTDTPPDASDVSPCCAYDDEDARACLIVQPDAPPSGTCGALLCPSEDGIRRINFCIP